MSKKKDCPTALTFQTHNSCHWIKSTTYRKIMKLNPQQIKRQRMEPEKKNQLHKRIQNKKKIIIKRMRVKIKIKNKLKGLQKVSIERLN
jgi:hypothetical protein